MISPIADIYTNSGYIRAVSDSIAAKRISEVSNLAGSISVNKISSENSKDSSSINSISPDFYSRLAYHFPQNSPLSKTQDTEKPFNDPQKVKKKDEQGKSFSDYMAGADTSENQVKTAQENTGKGYYIVFNDPSPQTYTKPELSGQELFRQRISSTYHTGMMKENGTLVNLTF